MYTVRETSRAMYRTCHITATRIARYTQPEWQYFNGSVKERKNPPWSAAGVAARGVAAAYKM